MEQEIFKAGVRPGSIGTQTEIKLLICFIMSNTRQSMSFEQLYEALSEKNLVNYFELVQAVDELCASGHIDTGASRDGPALFQTTPLGIQAGEELGGSLPLSVRENALDAAGRLLARERRRAELRVETVPEGSGFRVHLSIPDDEGPLVGFDLFVPSQEQCELVRRRFLNAPRFIYKGVLALLTGDREVLDEAFPPPEEQLF